MIIECERTFSKMNLIKTELRNQLTIDPLNYLMFISHHAPKNLKDFNPIPEYNYGNHKSSKDLLMNNNNVLSI